ncbi:MAG: hypothetical protein AAFN11_01080 [Chloroflexota bacterium]
MDEIIENVIGGTGGAVGGIFGEAREAIVGGCWGVFMSAGFLFFFFFAFMVLLFGIEGYDIQLGGIAIPFICMLGISAILSPFIGALFGANSGAYSMVRHVGCFILYLGMLLAAIVGVSMFL